MANGVQFFYPDGEKINSDEDFIQFYSRCYYLYNSSVAEKEIEELLQGNINKASDVMRILEWKLGRIDHKCSQCEGKTVYRHPDTMKNFKTKTRSGEINAKDLSKYISNKIDDLKEKKPAEIFSELVEQNVTNLGTVYLITLVYFISNKCPIYDRFAHQAIVAIKNGSKPGEVVKISSLPSKRANNVFEKYSKEYVEPLKEVFKDNYMNRDVDRALWVYGHLFRES